MQSTADASDTFRAILGSDVPGLVLNWQVIPEPMTCCVFLPAAAAVLRRKRPA